MEEEVQFPVEISAGAKVEAPRTKKVKNHSLSPQIDKGTNK
jgi:hypothetical protein